MTDSNSQSAFEEALAHQRAGDLERAEALYRAVLDAQPGHAAALHNLGALALQAGQPEAARPLIAGALAALPGRGEYRLTLAEALLQCGEPQAAQDALRDAPAALALPAAALRARAAAAIDHAARGSDPPADAARTVLEAYGAGRHEAAEIIARRMVTSYPASGFAWKALAAARQARGREAGAAAEKAASLLPEDAEALSLLAVERLRRGRAPEAETLLRRALVLRPGQAETLFNLGVVLQELGRPQEAIDCFGRSLDLRPDYVEALVNAGLALYETGQTDAAAEHLRRALALRRDSHETLLALGTILAEQGQIGEAEACYRRAAALRPGEGFVHTGLGNVLAVAGRLDEALQAYRRAAELAPDFAGAYSNLLLIANSAAETPSRELLQEARAFGARFAPPDAPWPCPARRADPQKRLRIGLVSGDFRAHPVGLFLESAIAALPEEELELFAYSTNRVEDAQTARFKALVPRWRAIEAMRDAEAAARIREDAIDILVDLSGHTAGNRLPLFARKPAPVQATWLGYFATTGLAAMDYVIGDRWVLPEGEEGHFVERPWRLPDSYLCFTPPQFDLAPGPLPALESGRITFGCFNNLMKLGDAVVAAWARLLQSVPEARLFLKTTQLSDAGLRARTLARFAARGVAPERLLLEGRAPRAELLAAYRSVDIALDPFPYPGGTTSLEALWMGVPVLTLRGERFVSRVGESILHTAGLADWVAQDEDDYLRRATDFAADLPALAALRAQLRPQLLASPLCDAPRFARHLAEAWRGMWREWCARQ
jgi:predicted O-linked N-acetylglucosamine transferase (SPINDLY family)